MLKLILQSEDKMVLADVVGLVPPDQFVALFNRSPKRYWSTMPLGSLLNHSPYLQERSNDNPALMLELLGMMPKRDKDRIMLDGE